MRRRAAIAILLFCVPACAGSYSEFARGIDANNRGEADSALAHFSQAIAGRDLNRSYLPGAYLGRARAELSRSRCAEAVSDLSEAIRLKPDFVDAYALRADANHCLNRDQAALKDADAAIRLKPAAGYYFTRTRLYWAHGEYVKAHGDAMRAAAGDPGNGYIVLWAAMTALRIGRFDPARFDKLAAGSASDWPRPLIDLYAGRIAPAEVRRAADGNAERGCEADFYIGAWHAARGEKAVARSLYERAVAGCPRDFIAFDGARRELKQTS
jgi:tetratricopeptide (TPR) repeat protein